MFSSSGSGAANSRRKAGFPHRARLLATIAMVPLAAVGVNHLPPQAAQAQTTAVRSFSIPAQGLASAVSAFGRQSGLQVTLAASASNGVTTQAVQGSMTPQEALGRMLQGTGVPYRITGDGTAVIGAARPSAAAGEGVEGATQLETVTLTGEGSSGYMGAPDWVYDTPSSVAVVSGEAIRDAGVRDIREVFNSVAGAYAGEGVASFPTVSPNLRGVQDAGRVAVSIDGARQNAQDGGRYGSSSIGAGGTAVVDGAFIRQVEIDKNPGATAGNTGTLAGSVDFRTVGAADIIRDGKSWGAEADVATGSNGYDLQTSVIGSARLSEVFALTMGLSKTELNQYRAGRMGEATSSVDATGIRKDLRGRDTWGSMLKLEMEHEDIRASASWMHQQNDYAYSVGGNTGGTYSDISRFENTNDSGSLNFGWDPDSEWIDFKANLWFNDSSVLETRDARGNLSPETEIDKSLTSFGITLQNTSTANTPLGGLALNYGVEAFRDVANKSASSSSISQTSYYADNYGVFNPPGRRDMASIFLNGKLEPTTWFNVSGGLRYDWYRLKGTARYYNFGKVVTPATYVYASCVVYYQDVYPSTSSTYTTRLSWLNGTNTVRRNQAITWFETWNANPCGELNGSTFVQEGSVLSSTAAVREDVIYDEEIDRSGGKLLPSVTVEFVPVDWFKPYASYNQTYRPPTITEAFMSGGFAPGDGNPAHTAPNPWLRPETAETYEIGANIVTGGLITERDRLRIKAAAFYREIDDYIVLGTIYASQETARTYTGFVNMDGITRTRGVEVEANYNAGRFWFGGSATFLSTNWPSKTEVFSNGTDVTSGNVFAWNGNIPPRFKVTGDAGLRFFEEKLSLGARVTHVTPSQTAVLDVDTGMLTEYSDSYTTLDLYGSYKVNKNATLHLSANNVTDVAYIPANSSMAAAGRTLQARFNVKF
ncbi:TonB-dependent receptor [Pannonibacter phragmitetus]|nr:TonB-dependent receptor [Pannonibacter phragmitetus]